MKHYIRLLTNKELSKKQQHVWFLAAKTFIDVIGNAANSDNLMMQLIGDTEIVNGDKGFPYVYVIYTEADVDPKLAEKVVILWNKIYPHDFEIEASGNIDANYPIEIDANMFDVIQYQASKFIHNRWVEDKVQVGWHYGIYRNNAAKTDPKLRDWDSLNEQYRVMIEMSEDDAIAFLKEHPYLF